MTFPKDCGAPKCIRKHRALVAYALALGLAMVQIGCTPKSATPAVSDTSAVKSEISPELRALVEQRCSALIRPQLVEPDNIRSLKVSHEVDPGNRHVAKYCME